MMHRALVLLVAAACSTPAPTPEATKAPEAAEAEARVGPMTAAEVKDRVAESRKRLDSSKAGKVLWKAMEAHGGLETWFRQRTLAFTFDYRALKEPAKRKFTRNEVDVWSARARHTQQESKDGLRFGWDGKEAWTTRDNAFPSPPRFWALTPYYFAGVPFVFGDPGTHYELLEPAELDGQTYDLVKITFDDGTGDSPDDFYVVYVSHKDARVGALRYIVAWPGFFEQGSSSPEKFMRYEAFADAGNLSLVSRIRTHLWDPATHAVGAVTTEVDITDYKAGETWPESVFSAPEGAVVSAEMPRK